MENIEIPSVRDRDLRSILRHFGLEDNVDQGRVSCQSCSRKITWENLGALLVRNGGLVLFCDLSECFEVAANTTE